MVSHAAADIEDFTRRTAFMIIQSSRLDLVLGHRFTPNIHAQTRSRGAHRRD